METETNQQNNWKNYPISSESYDPSRCDGEKIRDQLNSPPEGIVCFSTDANKAGVSLRIIDIYTSNKDQAVCKEKLCRSEAEAEKAMQSPLRLSKDTTRPRVRVISIHSQKSVEPLQITAPLMQKLLFEYNVSPEFVSVIWSFGPDENIAESGSSNLYVQSSPGLEKKLSYELRYMEHSGRAIKPWSERHTGVYHHHREDFDLFILLQSVADSTAERRLRNMSKSESGIKELQNMSENPFRLHALIASSYVLDWRWKLRTLAQSFEETNDLAMVYSPDVPGPKELEYERVQRLRNVQDQVIGTISNCKSNLQILNGLSKLKESGVEGLSGLEFLITQLEGHIDGAGVLSVRIRNTIELIDHALNRHVQNETRKVYDKLNESTEKVRDYTGQVRDLTSTLANLTEANNKNNITVTVITLVSAIYLPGSFTATLFGMNFFAFDTVHNGIAIAGDFYIFLATWLPLTALTIGIYYAVRRYEERDGQMPWSYIRSKLKRKAQRTLDGKLLEGS